MIERTKFLPDSRIIRAFRVIQWLIWSAAGFPARFSPSEAIALLARPVVVILTMAVGAHVVTHLDPLAADLGDVGIEQINSVALCPIPCLAFATKHLPRRNRMP